MLDVGPEVARDTILLGCGHAGACARLLRRALGVLGELPSTPKWAISSFPLEQDTLDQVKLENEERAALGQGKTYDRHLP